MMVRLLLLMLAALHGALALDVTIGYDPPTLIFTLPLFERGAGSVVFNYKVKEVAHKGRGVRTSEGWQYRSDDVNIDPPDVVYANAEVYDVNGNLRMTTDRSSLIVGETRPVARLPSRRIRGATFFRDDFNSFNSGNWNYEVSAYGGFNGEFQVYTNDPRNVFTRNGNLYIKPTPTTDDPRFDENSLYHGTMDLKALFGTCTQPANYGCFREGKYGILPPVMSGKLTSVPTMKYGVVELSGCCHVITFMEPGRGLERFDIMESRGNNGDIGVGTVTSTLHWGPSADQNRFMKTHGEKKTGSWHDNFHTWRLEWTPDHLVTFVDNQQIMYINPGGGGFWQFGGFGGSNLWSNGAYMAPFDQEFYMILNVAVGGTSGFFPDNLNYGVQKPWRNSSPKADVDFWSGHNSWLPTWHGDDAAMLIDYVEFRHL